MNGKTDSRIDFPMLFILASLFLCVFASVIFIWFGHGSDVDKSARLRSPVIDLHSYCQLELIVLRSLYHPGHIAIVQTSLLKSADNE